MEVKKITEGMTAPQVAEVIDSNFKNQNKILEEDIAKQNNVIGVSEYKDFSEAEAVNVGNVRKYNGFLYECVEATTGAFDASKWKKSSFKAETEKKLSELESDIRMFKTMPENLVGYDYSKEVSELYIVSNLKNPSFWVLSDCTPILWFENNIACKFDFTGLERKNNTVYPLSVYYGATEEYQNGMVLGYVVFNDIYKAATHPQGYYVQNININFCKNKKNSPLVSSYLGVDVYKGAITTEKISDNAVISSKIAPKSITTEKVENNAIAEYQLAEKQYLFPLTKGDVDHITKDITYLDDIQELYLIPVLKTAKDVKFWYNDSQGVVLFFTINGNIYGAKNSDVLSNYAENSIIYPLSVYSGDYSLISSSPIIGYIIFKDVEGLKKKSFGSMTPNVNLPYCQNIKNCPIIAKSLGLFVNNNSIGKQQLSNEINESIFLFNNIEGYVDYSKAVSEILILKQEKLSKVVNGVGFWMYAYSPILWLKTEGGDIGCKYEQVVTQNGMVYPLSVYYGATEEYPNGTILGYVVFSDVDFAKEHGESLYAPNVNLQYCTIKNAPQIAKRLNYYGINGGAEYIPNLRLPNKIYAVVGDTLQLFYRAILDSWTISQYKIRCICNVGKSFPRYFEYTPTDENIGSSILTIQVINQIGKVIATKDTILQTTSKGDSPSNNKNIFIFGDSLTGGGQWVKEMYRRLVGSGGTPNADGKSNIRFCGSMVAGGANYFGVGGWSWTDYITKGRAGFRFFVSGVSSIDIGTIYTNNGHTYRVTEVNITEGIGNIRCDADSYSYVPESSGILVKSAGTGDANVYFSSYSLDSQNPLWDDEKEEFTFKPYVEKYGDGQCDVVYTLLSWNALPSNRIEDTNEASFETIKSYVKTFADKLHEEFPNAKLKLIGLQCPSLDGGYTANYGASEANWVVDFHGLKNAFYCNKMLQTFANSEGYSDFVEFVDAGFQFDAEHGEQFTMKPVNVRMPNTTEKIGTNGVHPSEAGYMMFADAVYRNFVANFCQS